MAGAHVSFALVDILARSVNIFKSGVTWAIVTANGVFAGRVSSAYGGSFLALIDIIARFSVSAESAVTGTNVSSDSICARGVSVTVIFVQFALIDIFAGFKSVSGITSVTVTFVRSVGVFAS